MNQMSQDELFDFLAAQPHIGRLATVDRRCRPHVVPVWYAVGGDRILVHTMGSMKKVRNVIESGRFAMTVDTDEWPYRGVSVQGVAEVLDADQFDHRFVEHLAVQHLGEEGQRLGRHLATMSGDHVTLALDPESWQSWDYR